MSDDFSGFEAELRQFKPAVPAGDLHERVAGALAGSPARGHRWGDRFLVSAMSLGLAAAVLIVAMVALDVVGDGKPAAPVSYTDYADAPAIVQTREFLALLAVGKDVPGALPGPVTTAPN